MVFWLPLRIQCGQRRSLARRPPVIGSQKSRGAALLGFWRFGMVTTQP